MNNKYKKLSDNKGKGFTIIEVVLVLAIAGLIFLMVFVALPALQRGQRDAQRKSDLTRVSVQMTQYLTSTRGAIPDTNTKLKTFVSGFLDGSGFVAGDQYIDPDGTHYTLKYELPPSKVGEIGYYPKSNCDISKTNGIKSSTAARDFAFTIKLENQSAPFCLDNKA